MEAVLKSNRWTTKETTTLIELFPTHTCRQIATMLERSLKSVQHHRFLISKRKLYTIPSYQDLSPQILSYAAGIVDGEGYIGISLSSGRYYSLKVEVSNTSKALVEFLVQHFGGKYNLGKRPNRKIYYRWFLGSKHAEQFLQAIQPYAIIKKRQILIALEFRETRLNEQRGLFYRQIRELNTKQYA